jgi:predicted dehydrogenase
LNPAVAQLRRRLDAAAVGRVLNATVFSSTMAFGAQLPPDAVALEDPAVGMNLPTIQTAHTLDLVTTLLGPFTTLAAQFSTQYPKPTVQATGDAVERVLPDHVLAFGRVADVPVAVQVTGGRPAGDCPFRLEIQGERGTLALVGGSPRGFQAGRLHLEHDGAPVEAATGETAGLDESVVNVAGVWAALRDDLRDGTATAPSLDDALRLSRLLDDVRESANRGVTIHSGAGGRA